MMRGENVDTDVKLTKQNVYFKKHNYEKKVREYER